MDNLLSVRQVAFILKVHHLTIRRYIKEGKLKAVKVGGNVRIKESELTNFHKELSNATPQQSIIIRAKKQFVAKPFTQLDPLLQLQGKGASLSS
ncbi:MAG: helix-turn-helix domain-containing protein [Candidatus Levyibacteriota bacterium]